MDTTTETTDLRLAACYANPDWQGWGYLGERDRAATIVPDRVPVADEVVLAAAEQWDDAQLFDWANSKLGRWFGDIAFGTLRLTTADELTAKAREFRLFDLTRLGG